MNNYQIAKYSEQFAESSITINPYIMKRLGIVKAKCLLRINDYQLACVPYTISLKDCRVLLILSPREQQIITGIGNQNTILHMEFHHPNLGKTVPLFFRITIKSFKQLNLRLSQCLLEAVFLTIPQDYREIILEYFLKDEENQKIFNNPYLSNKTIPARSLFARHFSKRAFLRQGRDIRMECRIIEISLKKALVFIDTDEKHLEISGQKVILEILQDKDAFFVNAVFSDFTPSSEVEGFFIVRLTLEYSSLLTEGLSKLLKQIPNVQPGETPENGETPSGTMAEETSEIGDESGDADDVLEESEPL